MPSRQLINFIAKQSGNPSGVQTFLAQFDQIVANIDFSYSKVGLPAENENSAPIASIEMSAELQSQTACEKHGLSLALGYLRMVWKDLRQVRTSCSTLSVDRQAILIVQEFGCETLPIALRLAFPRNRIVAISHTVPGQDEPALKPVRRWIERICYWAVSDIVFNSNELKRAWAIKLHRPGIKGTVIWHGLAEPSETIPSDYPVKNGDPIDFVYVARFCYGKNHHGLLRAWRKALDKTRRRIRLILIGDGPTFGPMRQLATELGLTEGVFFLGARNNGAAYFSLGDVGVLLSKEEAFGLVLLEAMCRGKPVIASRLGGILEVVEPGVTGLLVDPDNADEVASAIVQLAESEELRKIMGLAGLDRWKKLFSFETMIRKYAVYLQSIRGLRRTLFRRIRNKP